MIGRSGNGSQWDRLQITAYDVTSWYEAQPSTRYDSMPAEGRSAVRQRVFDEVLTDFLRSAE